MTNFQNPPFIVGTLALALFAGCAEKNDAPEGIAPARTMGGAKIKFDLNARPLPEIPFPNDVATTIDPESPTGRRVNVSTMAATKLEQKVRRQANELDGFSPYGPIYLSFDKPLDIHNILDRHTGPTPDFGDDAVFLVNVDPDSEEYGKLEVIDLGRGNFPVTMKDPDKYFDFDPRAHGTNLIFESVQEEDENGNGVLDPLEDTDDDGVWDTPNTLTPGADPLADGQMLEFYERETNTLIIRPLDTLEPATTYAVVLSRALIDEDGLAVDSPFPFVNHARQTEALAPLKRILPNALPDRFDESLEAVRFAWTFTTQTSTYEMELIRAGMYGHGPLDWLAKAYPPELALIHRTQSREDAEMVLTTPVTDLINLLLQALAADLSSEAQAALSGSAEDIDYMVSGSYRTPYFLSDKDGRAGTPEEMALNENEFDENEAFRIDYNYGDAIVGYDEVTWSCVVPKERPGRKAPFPVAIYGHGYGSSRLESLGFAPLFAKFGLATCAIDNAGHGLPLDRFVGDLPIDIVGPLENLGLEGLDDALGHGRQRDLTNDGLDDPGGDYWTADTFHTRDMVRQTTIDYMQFVRIMRSWDGTTRWPDSVDEDDPYVSVRRDLVAGWDTNGDGQPEIAGDFNGDGVVDFGGEQPYYAWGQSLGGIQSAVLVGIDPAVRGAAPTAGGAGLGDIALRSTQTGVPEAVLLRMFGPILLGRPIERWNAAEGKYEWTGSSQLEWLIPDSFDEIYLPFATVDGLEHGDRIVLRNLQREQRPELVEEGFLDSRVTVRNGVFRTGLAADAVGTNERRQELGFDSSFSVRDLHKRFAAPRPGLERSWYLRRGQRQLLDVDNAEDGDAVFASFTAGDLPDDVKPDEFSVTWRGVMESPTAEAITFRIETQGRAQLYIDGKRVLDVRNGEDTTRQRLGEGRLRDFELRFDQTSADGFVRLFWSGPFDEEPVPADAFTTHRPLTEEERAEYDKHVIENARDWGDSFVIEIYSADDLEEPKRVIDTFERDVFYQNVLYPAGSPLAALTEGWGLKRQSPQFRRFFSIAQMILAKADPGSYAPHYFRKPLKFDYETPQFQDGTSNVLVIPTLGDSAVPVNTGLSLARTAGILDYKKYDPRYGMTPNQFLVQQYVYEGIYWLDRHAGYPDAIYDPDDLDNGLFRSTRFEDPARQLDPNADAPQPLRATVFTSAGTSGLRLPYLGVQGVHGFDLPKPEREFDIDTFMTNQVGYYFATDGQELSDDPCLQDVFMTDCAFFDANNWNRPDAQ